MSNIFSNKIDKPKKSNTQDFRTTLKETRIFLILWLSQSFSGLGSSMTGFALVIWSYNYQGSALDSALLMVCSYAPYVIFSIFAGALSDRWNKKKTMLLCDSIAALTTLIVLVLLQSGSLRIWHLYIINAVNGLMNTVQQPASEVATTRVLPRKYYQRVGGLRYFSGALTSILTPIIATAVLGLFGMNVIILFDLITFAVAFLILLIFIRIPEQEEAEAEKEAFGVTVKSGLVFLKENRGIFGLILFLAAINFVASVYDAAFPAMMLSREGGSEQVMGLVNAVVGVSTLAGSILASLMNTNLDAIMRLHIPEAMQGRVYAVRNSLQFFTIPVGYFLGGFLVDRVFEPVMALQNVDSLLVKMFGSGKGSGAAFLFFVLAFAGIAVCLIFRRNKEIWGLEDNIKEHILEPISTDELSN